MSSNIFLKSNSSYTPFRIVTVLIKQMVGRLIQNQKKKVHSVSYKEIKGKLFSNKTMLKYDRI